MGLHFLALELRMPVGELCDRMSASEFQAWEQFFVQRAEAQAEAQAKTGAPAIELAALDPKALQAMF